MKKTTVNFTLRTWTGMLVLAALMGSSCFNTHSYASSTVD